MDADVQELLLGQLDGPAARLPAPWARIALDALDVYEPLAHERQQHVEDTLNLAIYRFRIAHNLQAPG